MIRRFSGTLGAGTNVNFHAIPPAGYKWRVLLVICYVTTAAVSFSRTVSAYIQRNPSGTVFFQYGASNTLSTNVVQGIVAAIVGLTGANSLVTPQTVPAGTGAVIANLTGEEIITSVDEITVQETTTSGDVTDYVIMVDEEPL